MSFPIRIAPIARLSIRRLATLDNYTAYIFLFPLGEIHPDAVRKATAIWCAPDKAAAWIATMRDHKAIDTATCDTPIVRNRALGESFGIDGTPAIYLADGMPFENSSDALDAAMTAAAVPAVKTP
ncbi:MAG: thioredoxin fold domain-containing protein [Asticcacaulis sp.]